MGMKAKLKLARREIRRNLSEGPIADLMKEVRRLKRQRNILITLIALLFSGSIISALFIL